MQEIFEEYGAVSLNTIIVIILMAIFMNILHDTSMHSGAALIQFIGSG
ncbi:hypothetical protein [Parasporobacterium paucivorans]|uniref:Uncharacterized protein n=1 Tax=Parasporobacterium paucivorans DSM 15970 TaxID=1122934 RepID=A0A1M6FVG7_9FIRM|nr:hypothetical protein [Parasporobacterium paucivorans]SHJ01706.1 hypothetical protein SAMN02745691_01213 [Parasporobacterium paucivorans DSM 15970]